MSRRHWSKTLHEDPSDGCMRCTGHIDPSAFIAELHARCGEVKSENPGCERHCNASMVRHVYHKHLPTGPAEFCSVILIPCEPGEQGAGRYTEVRCWND